MSLRSGSPLVERSVVSEIKPPMTTSRLVRYGHLRVDFLRRE